MKKYVHIFLFAAIVIALLFYGIPREIIKDYDGYVYTYGDKNIGEHVKVSLEGKLYRKILSDDVFSGQIIIEGKKININSPPPGSLNAAVKGIGDKLSRKSIFTVGSSVKDGYQRTSAVFDFTRDFKFIMGYTDSLREKYNVKNAVIVCPAKCIEDAEKIVKGDMWQ